MKQIIKETDSENGVGERPNIKLFGRYIANHAAVYGESRIVAMSFCEPRS